MRVPHEPGEANRNRILRCAEGDIGHMRALLEPCVNCEGMVRAPLCENMRFSFKKYFPCLACAPRHLRPDLLLLPRAGLLMGLWVS